MLDFSLTSVLGPGWCLLGLDTAAHTGGGVLMPTRRSCNCWVMGHQDFAYAVVFPGS